MNTDPVEIDIVLKQNVQEEADKASRGIDGMAESSEAAWKRSKEALQIQRDVIARLRKELEPLQKEYDKVNIGTNDPKVIAQREKLSKAVREVVTELRGEEDALKDMMSASDKTVEKSRTLETQIRNVREEMMALVMAGQRESESYKAKEEELNTLSVAYREVRNTQTQLQKGGASLQGIVSGISGITGIMSAGAGAFGLLNQEGEKFQRIQTKVQSLMAITIGLQQVQNTLHQTSAFRIQTVTRAKQVWTGATTRLAVALGISNVAAQALIGTLTLGLSVAIGFAIGIIDRYVSKQREAREEQKKFSEAVVNSSAEQVAGYEKLRTSYNKLGDDIKAKEKFILENKSAFNQLGVSINTVNDADNAFITNTEAFKSSVNDRAMAIASMELAAEKYKSAMLKRKEADERERDPNRWDKLTGVSDFYDRDGKRKLLNSKSVDAADKMRAEADKEEAEAQAWIDKHVNLEKSAAQKLEDANIDAINSLEEGTKAYWEAQKKNAQQKLDALKDTDKGSAPWNAIVKEIEDADKAIKQFDTRPEKQGASGGESPLVKAQKKLAGLSVNLQKETDAAIVAAMEEGRDKKLAKLTAEYDARKALIEERTKEIEELETTTGVDGSKQKGQLIELAKAEKARYESQVKAVGDGSRAAIDSVMADIDARFKTQNELRMVEIDRFYAEQTEKARENGATQAELDTISLQHKRDIELEKHHAALETLDFEAQIAIRRAQIEDKDVMLQSQRQEKLLKIQIAAAEKRLAKLKEIKEKGGDADKDIAATTAEIEALNATLDRMPVEKFQEISEYLQAVLNGVGDFASILDKDLGGLMDMASGAVGGITSLATGIASGDPRAIIDGAMQMLDVVGKVINANKQANEEIRKFNLSLAQQAIEYSLAVIRAIKDVKSETDSIFSSNFTNTLTQGMSGYNSAIAKQSQLMRELGDATVKTGVKKKKFLGITYGTKDVYSNLLKQYPELIKKDGELNRELAETLKASGSLSEETATLIDNILSAADAAKEALQAVETELQNLAGTIGQELKKALDDAFASGTDSARDMTKSVVNMLKEISTQKLFNAVFGGLFSDLEKRMKDSYAAGGDGDITDDIGWFMDNYPALVDQYNKGLEEFQKAIQDRYGEDAFEADGGRKAVSKAISGVSQDSFDDFSGRLTFLVMKVTDIVALNTESHETGQEQLFVMRAMLSQLDTIAENSEFLRKLAGIEEDISKMARDGINIKR